MCRVLFSFLILDQIFRQNDQRGESWLSSLFVGDSLGITGGSFEKFVKPQPKTKEARA